MHIEANADVMEWKWKEGKYKRIKVKYKWPTQMVK